MTAVSRTIIGKEIARQFLPLRSMAKSRSLGQDMVESVFEQIVAALARGEDVRVKGFGTFAVRHLAARDGRNPQNGEKIAIAASDRVTFRPHGALKAALKAAPSSR